MLAVLLSPMPATAMLVVQLSLSPLPRHYRYARRAAVAGLTGMLPDGRPCRRHAHHLAMLLSLCFPPQCPPCCTRCAGRRHARRAALAVPATATLPLRTPCRCGRAHRNAARRLPVPPSCSPSRHAAVAVLAAAMPAVPL
ncbi:hypothetical protein PF006_g26952 [Phytophthora fragariae]|uniref:Uncharacterized protein n=1 Tax=Phytophthora fragariae TaxID=53985 RepID=A0A6A3QSA6_9STRA|nr:hypothetical protein PF006_g26952 [Phytophthora fragariae]